ncbi:MAG: hypothetical protein OXC18_20665 [Desulfurellaceae bacterium]|nr:hypothetical protein [Desulfurellaceae bacterium]
MQEFHKIASGLHDIGSALVKRGTAMGPLVPSLIAVPILLLFAWLFRETAVLMGFPVITVTLVIIMACVLYSYHRHYASFAKNDPDRLQSEEYRYEMTRVQMLAAKGLQEPLPEDSLPLADPTRNLSGADTPNEGEEASASAVRDQEKAP